MSWTAYFTHSHVSPPRHFTKRSYSGLSLCRLATTLPFLVRTKLFSSSHDAIKFFVLPSCHTEGQHNLVAATPHTTQPVTLTPCREHGSNIPPLKVPKFLGSFYLPLYKSWAWQLPSLWYFFIWLTWAFLTTTPVSALASSTTFGFKNLAITIGLDHLSSSFAEMPFPFELSTFTR